MKRRNIMVGIYSRNYVYFPVGGGSIRVCGKIKQMMMVVDSNMNYVSVILVYVMHGLLRSYARCVVFILRVNVFGLFQFERGIRTLVDAYLWNTRHKNSDK